MFIDPSSPSPHHAQATRDAASERQQAVQRDTARLEAAVASLQQRQATVGAHKTEAEASLRQVTSDFQHVQVRSRALSATTHLDAHTPDARSLHQAEVHKAESALTRARAELRRVQREADAVAQRQQRETNAARARAKAAASAGADATGDSRFLSSPGRVGGGRSDSRSLFRTHSASAVAKATSASLERRHAQALAQAGAGAGGAGGTKQRSAIVSLLREVHALQREGALTTDAHSRLKGLVLAACAS